jgi:alkylation response protein AidB-like acyl-CoA dehydrogenase
VVFDGVAPAALAAVPPHLADWLHAMGAVARACQMAGALQAILARSVAYAGERVAFDRPIGKFQAIQHALARLAGEAAAALAASGSAADALAEAGVASAIPASGDDPDGTLRRPAPRSRTRCTGRSGSRRASAASTPSCHGHGAMTGSEARGPSGSARTSRAVEQMRCSLLASR